MNSRNSWQRVSPMQYTADRRCFVDINNDNNSHDHVSFEKHRNTNTHTHNSSLASQGPISYSENMISLFLYSLTQHSDDKKCDSIHFLFLLFDDVFQELLMMIMIIIICRPSGRWSIWTSSIAIESFEIILWPATSPCTTTSHDLSLVFAVDLVFSIWREYPVNFHSMITMCMCVLLTDLLLNGECDYAQRGRRELNWIYSSWVRWFGKIWISASGCRDNFPQQTRQYPFFCLSKKVVREEMENIHN